MAKIGFYGGAFNPPTKAHIELAKKAMSECDLDKVIFVPVGDSYKKDGMAKGEHRVKMLELACKDNDKLEVSDMETRSNIEYKAIDIFNIIDKDYNSDDKFFIMGADNLKKMSTWKDSENLVKNFKYIILDRDDKGADDIINNDNLLKENKEKFNIIKNKDYKDCSSTIVRKKIENGDTPTDISKEVYNYIKENKIYFV